jgi:uncharacterized integral membrane protein
LERALLAFIPSFLRRLARLLFFVAVGMALVSFIASNPARVALSLFPFPFTLELPLYALGLAALFTGIVLGGFLVSAGSVAERLRLRRQRRRDKQALEATRHEVTALRLEQQHLRAQR